MPVETAGERSPIQRIVVRVTVGDDRMAATDDPVFLRLEGPGGREFRLDPARGKAFARGKQQVFELASADSGDSSVAHPELNDPTRPSISLAGVQAVRLLKAMNPIPNVRGVGELDDRLLVEDVEVDLYGENGSGPLRYRRRGPVWLGLVCGLSLELQPVDDGA